MRKIGLLIMGLILVVSGCDIIDDLISTEYEIEFHDNGADLGQPPGIITAKAGNSVVVPGRGTLTRSGYTFGGWNQMANGSGTNYSPGDTFTMPNHDIDLYAKWISGGSGDTDVTINFDANGGTGTMASQSVTENGSVTLSTNTFTRTGHTFAGWATTATGTVEYADGASFTAGTEDVTLYAVWTSDSTPSFYTLTFYANDGSNTSTTQDIEEYTTVTLDANTFTRTGYTFQGWATSPTGSVVYSDGDSYSMGAVATFLWAVWESDSQEPETYTLTFYANDGTTDSTTQDIEENTTVTLDTNTFTRTGYTFQGWATSATGSVMYTDGAPYTMGSADASLWAVWVLDGQGTTQYTLTFYANDGTSTSTNQIIEENTTVALDPNTFMRTGYTFVGWATSATGSVAYIDETQYPMGSANASLWAVWILDSQEPDTYTLTFYANDETTASTTQLIEEYTTVNLDMNPFTREGYTFAGWATSAVGAPVSYADGDSYSMEAADASLWAVWNSDGEAIGIIVGDGESIDISAGD